MQPNSRRHIAVYSPNDSNNSAVLLGYNSDFSICNWTMSLRTLWACLLSLTFSDALWENGPPPDSVNTFAHSLYTVCILGSFNFMVFNVVLIQGVEPQWSVTVHWVLPDPSHWPNHSLIPDILLRFSKWLCEQLCSRFNTRVNAPSANNQCHTCVVDGMHCHCAQASQRSIRSN